MAQSITIEGFESLITARVLCDRLIDRKARCYRNEFDYDELLTQGVYASNDLLKELKLSDEAWFRRRGKKVFMFCEQTHRILAELVIVADKTKNNMFVRPLFVMIDRQGIVKEQTLAGLLARSTRIRQYQHLKRRQASNHIRYIEQAKQFAKKGAESRNGKSRN